MEDLQYIVSIGFSGADVTQALTIGLLVSLLICRHLRPWAAVFLAFMVDRSTPFYGMFSAGYETDVIWASIWGTFLAIPQNIVYYFIRYIGMILIVFSGYKLRLVLHRTLGAEHDGRIFSYKSYKT